MRGPMNDDELDAMLRGIPTPERPAELAPARKTPIAELVVFFVLALLLLAWAFGALNRVFGA